MAATICSPLPRVHATLSTANFWISPVDAGPAAPTIYSPPGETTVLQVWARPATDNVLNAFSLNLVATTAGVLAFDNVTVSNPVVIQPSTVRYQLVFDTSTGLIVDADGVRGFQGLNILAGGGLATTVGIGPDCVGDTGCMAGSGSPSWQLATVSVHGDAYGSTELFLEIGTQGLWQYPAATPGSEVPTSTQAVFGAADDVVHGWGPTAVPDMRNTHSGAADAVLVIATADFNQDGPVNGSDFLIWQRGFPKGTTLATGDADGNALVNATDRTVWSYQFGSTFTPLVAVGQSVPEPGSLVIAMIGVASALAPLRRSRRV